MDRRHRPDVLAAAHRLHDLHDLRPLRGVRRELQKLLEVIRHAIRPVGAVVHQAAVVVRVRRCRVEFGDADLAGATFVQCDLLSAKLPVEVRETGTFRRSLMPDNTMVN